MKLQQVQRHRFEDFSEFGTTGVDEQPDCRNKRRQRFDDRARLLKCHSPRTFRVKHKPYGVGPGIDRRQRIFYAGNPANLAANG
ncbi:hypothetical protein D3C85_1405600 [compost metagenome]